MKRKVLICGATGFIGRNCTAYFSQRPHLEIHAVRFQRNVYPCEGVIWHQVDLRQPEAVNDIVKGKDIIIQMAATTSGAKDIVNAPYLHVTDNAVMNAYLFKAAFMHGVEHVIFPSCTVMYQSSEKPLRETDFNANTALYPHYFGVGHTKLYLEKMCEFYANISTTKFTAIRHSNIYGPHDKFDLEKSHVFGATLSKVMTAKDKLTIWGNGEEARDLLYVEDLLRFIEAAIDKQSEKFRLYNCGYGVPVTINELAKKMIHHTQKKLTIEHDLSKPTIKTSLCLDTSLAQQELDWLPRVSLDDGIKKTIKWWQENQEIKWVA